MNTTNPPTTVLIFVFSFLCFLFFPGTVWKTSPWRWSLLPNKSLYIHVYVWQFQTKTSLQSLFKLDIKNAVMKRHQLSVYYLFAKRHNTQTLGKFPFRGCASPIPRPCMAHTSPIQGTLLSTTWHIRYVAHDYWGERCMCGVTVGHNTANSSQG